MSAHTVYCNVVRLDCSDCGKYRAYCVTHGEPTEHNRCTCVEQPDVEWSSAPPVAGVEQDARGGITPWELARLFHEHYERLAASFGYTTRPDSAVSWDGVPEANRALMVATAEEVLRTLRAPLTPPTAEAQPFGAAFPQMTFSAEAPSEEDIARIIAVYDPEESQTLSPLRWHSEAAKGIAARLRAAPRAPAEPSYDDWPAIAKQLEAALRAKRTDAGYEYHDARGYNACVVCRLLWALTYPGPATITVWAPADAEHKRHDGQRGPIGWVVVYRSKDDELRVEQQYTNSAPYVMTDRAEADGWCGECNDAEAECGGSGTYTVEPVGIGGAPDGALREEVARLKHALGEIVREAIRAVHPETVTLGEIAARALAREATPQGGNDAAR